MGNVLLLSPNSPAMGRDEQTPLWVQYIVEVDDLDALMAAKTHIEGEGLEVSVSEPRHLPLDLFLDPSGHRIELAANVGRPSRCNSSTRWRLRCSRSERHQASA